MSYHVRRRKHAGPHQHHTVSLGIRRSAPLIARTWAVDVPLVTVMRPSIPGLMARQWPVVASLGDLWPSVGYTVPSRFRCQARQLALQAAGMSA